MAMNFNVILCVVCFLFMNCRFASASSGTCQTANHGTGWCVPLPSCKPMLLVLEASASNHINTWLLRQAHCGFEGNDPKVCCPIEQQANVIDAATPPPFSQTPSTTQIPSTSTQTPSTSTQTPSSTTQIPSTTTQIPSITTQIPSITTQIPSKTTQIPSTTTQVPTTTTQTPSTTTQIPLTIPQAASRTSVGDTSQATLKSSTPKQKVKPAIRVNRPTQYKYDLVTMLGETCTTIYKTTGCCKELILCKPFAPMMNTAATNPAHDRILRQSHCGFIDTRPKVCCPLPGQPTTLIPPVTVSPSVGERAGGDLTSNSKPPVTRASQMSPNIVLNVAPVQLRDVCTTLYNTAGSCQKLSLCEPLAPLLDTAATNAAHRTILQKSHCGFDGSSPKVCCPLASQPTLAPPVTVPPSTGTSTAGEPTSRSKLPFSNGVTNVPPAEPRDGCTTLYNTAGSCQKLSLCEPLAPLLDTAATNAAHRTILQKSHCGFDGSLPKVCCPLPIQTRLVPSVTAPPATAEVEGDYLTSLPEPPVCGVSNMSLTKVVNGIPAKLGALPWMAMLGYEDLALASGVRWKCGGVLISHRHVLTAAHCIHQLETTLIVVRLGELDWTRDDDGASPIDVPIKRMIKHESYTRNNPELYDIGLLVLQRDIEFTDLIKPICLPLKFRTMNFEDFNPLVAGWGNIDQQRNGIVATHLQVAQVPVLDQAVCEQAYRNQIPHGFHGQAFCAGYMAGQVDACSGDSGGPLMQPMPSDHFKTYTYCIGVVSFGFGCGLAGYPGVYTRVTHYLPWIEDKILMKTSP